jgi:hypothetical protein
MLRVIGDALDLAYIEHWATEVGVTDLWAAMWDEHQKRSGQLFTPRNHL